MDKRLSLEHLIRNIAEGKFTPSDEPKISLEHAIRNVAEGIGTIGDDKPKGTPTTFMTRKYKSQNGGHVAAGKGAHTNMKQADDIKLECAPSDMSGVSAQLNTESGKKKIKEGDLSTDGAMSSGDCGSLSATESGKKKMKEEAEYADVDGVSKGTEERRKVKSMARFKDFGPKSSGSTLNKTGQIMTKIIDEDAKRADDENNDPSADEMPKVKKTIKDTDDKDKVKNPKGKTGVEWNPTIKSAANDKDSLPESVEHVEEGKIKDIAKVASVVGALGAHAGKVYDAGNVAISQDPGHAITTAMTYANPTSRALNMMPTAFKSTAVNKDEDEKARQKKFGTKLVAKEEEEMTDEVKNPLIDSFLALQGDKTGNIFEAAKKLSAKQKKIAAVAGDKDEIDAADFAALRAGKKVEEEVEQVDEISGAKLGSYMVASKKDETARRDKGIEVRDQLRKETGMHFGTPIDRKLHSPTASRGAMQKLAVKKLSGTAKVPATEDVEFSAEELAHFDSVVEALGQSKDATQKGSFKKAGSTTTNGDPVRPTVPDRDLTDSVIEETEKKEYKKLSYDEFVKGRIENPTPEQHKEIGRRLKKAGVPGSGWHFKKAKEMQKNVKEENIDEARGRPKKADDDAPTHSGRDPKQHIQVVAGQAAAGRHIEFHHNDGSKTTITPDHGRKIVAHLNSLKPAERHSAVNKMHDSAKGMKL